MQIYLPIAEISVNIFLLIGLGGIVGILSGMFGVGGGFLMTPLLFFIGIPPAIAVVSEANQILGASFSGAIAHFKRKNVDLKIWRNNFHNHIQDIKKLGFTTEFINLWEFYFVYCEAGFRERNIGDYQFIFSKPSTQNIKIEY